ncbi:M56 family metallopeptidase [Tenacibaculum jejuense]|uniref:Peptidase M56 domain-containing protein n=1 Tax=Tenacibaculum jejuense TaxID=584609 RepID=A0A238U6J1_9FLAO|nr:M56 family metallopeptidase [Tenacibaculum jejuense]SNR14821.1 conserved membrane protein of unknown function [Tenacibaculum jejuense]
MSTYILQVIMFQTLFLIVYDFVLSKETFFSKNRWYLIGSALLSFVLPIIKIPTFQQTVEKEYSDFLPELTLSPEIIIEQQETSIITESLNYTSIIFYSGIFVFTLLFLLKLSKIASLLIRNSKHKKKQFTLVLLPSSTKAFSFFNFIFLGDQITTENKENIIAHELVHIKQKHSIDLLFFELLKIVMWFNPLVWLYQKRITLVHEFISDDIVSKTKERSSYINSLLSDVFQVENIVFVNQFAKHSLIKKRIHMITKKESRKIKQLKYLLIIPTLFSMLFYTVCVRAQENLSVLEDLLKEELLLNNEITGKEDERLVEKEKFEERNKTKDQTSPQKQNTPKLISKKKNNKRSNIKKETKEIKENIIKKDTLVIEEKPVVEVVATQKQEVTTEELLAENKTQITADRSEKTEVVTNAAKEEVIQEDVKELFPLSQVDKFPSFIGKGFGKEAFDNHITYLMRYKMDWSPFGNMYKKEDEQTYAYFHINKEGKIENIRIRTKDPRIRKGLIKFIKSWPPINPAEYRGKPVKVSYVLPVKFKKNQRD